MADRSGHLLVGSEVLAVGGDMTHDALAMIEYRSDPAVFIFGDSDAAIARWRAAADAAEVRVAGAGLIGEAMPPVSNVALLVEAAAEEEALAPLLASIERDAASRDRRAVISVAPELVDLAAALVRHPNLRLQCNPSAADRATDLAAMLAPRANRLHDVGREGYEMLRKLAEEAGRIATTLASLAEAEACELAKAEEAEGANESDLDPAVIRAIIRARRLRDRYFASALFADPAWDMLLDLMAARLENVSVAVSSLCIASAVPATTALRWIRTLTDNGLFVRVADPDDGRRVFIGLSDQAARSLAAWLHAVQRITPAPV